MESYKLKDLFGKEEFFNCLYVVRNFDQIYYVGKAGKNCVSQRMISHIRHYYENNSHKFAKLLFDNFPGCFEWTVDVMSVESARAVTGEKYCCITTAEAGLYDYYKANKKTPLGNGVRPSSKCNCKK